MRLLVLVVVEEETAVEHDWVVLLSDLVCRWQVSIDVVLSVEFNHGKDATSKSKRCLDSDIKTILVEDWKHAWQSNIDKVGMRVWFGKT